MFVKILQDVWRLPSTFDMLVAWRLVLGYFGDISAFTSLLSGLHFCTREPSMASRQKWWSSESQKDIT